MGLKTLALWGRMFETTMLAAEERPSTKKTEFRKISLRVALWEVQLFCFA